MAKNVKPDIPLSYFKEHTCSLPRNKLPHRIVCGRLRRWILEQTTVSTSDARARAIFRSYASLGAEKYRHYKHHPFTIHPYSKLKLYFDTLIAILIVLWQFSITLHIGAHVTKVRRLEYCTILCDILDLLYIINIVLNFITGYVKGDTEKIVVLGLKKASLFYVKTWFLVDLLSSIMAILFNFLSTVAPLRVLIIFSILKILRLLRLFAFTKNFLQAFNFGIKVKSTLYIFLIMTSYICWNVLLQLLVEIYIEGTMTPEQPRKCSWMTVSHIWNETATIKTAFTISNAFALLRKHYNRAFYKEDACIELLLVISWIIAYILLIKCATMYFVILLATQSARVKYFIMTRVLKKFMNHKKLPVMLQKMIMEYYAMRFQSHFFVESRLLETVTGQLREDIIMHTRSQLVQNNKFLKQLPRSLQMKVSLKLQSELFTAGDVIFKANSIGDRIYFIDRGTVSVFSASGHEYCHLEDGDYFGETSLIKKDRIRIATIVAVTNCELFRLDREDFENSMECYPLVFEKIKKESILRYQRVQLLEDQLKGKMKMSYNK